MQAKPNSTFWFSCEPNLCLPFDSCEPNLCLPLDFHVNQNYVYLLTFMGTKPMFIFWFWCEPNLCLLFDSYKPNLCLSLILIHTKSLSFDSHAKWTYVYFLTDANKTDVYSHANQTCLLSCELNLCSPFDSHMNQTYIYFLDLIPTKHVYFLWTKSMFTFWLSCEPNLCLLFDSYAIQTPT